MFIDIMAFSMKASVNGSTLLRDHYYDLDDFPGHRFIVRQVAGSHLWPTRLMIEIKQGKTLKQRGFVGQLAQLDGRNAPLAF
jgi:hypothetical protein